MKQFPRWENVLACRASNEERSRRGGEAAGAQSQSPAASEGRDPPRLKPKGLSCNAHVSTHPPGWSPRWRGLTVKGNRPTVVHTCDDCQALTDGFRVSS